MMGVICLTGILLHHRSSLVFGTLGYALFFAYEIYITIVCLTKTHLCLVCSSNNIINRTYYALIGVFFVQLEVSSAYFSDEDKESIVKDNDGPGEERNNIVTRNLIMCKFTVYLIVCQMK
uniref:Uncharacterized protein n=1 Tax=Glossina brevipalpis TaxID=37001 RepID=A0A1A9WQT0_9MUSC